RCKSRYAKIATAAVRLRWPVLVIYLIATCLIILLVGHQLGLEIFPKVEAGQLQVRLRAPTGTRVERTEAIALQVLDLIKQEVGPDKVALTLGFVGVHAAS